MENSNEIIEKENSKLIIKEEVLTNKEALEVLYGIKEGPYVQEVVVWNKLYKKKVLNNIVFPVGKLHEDEFTTHKILFNSKKIVVSNRYIHGYIQSKNSIMRKEIALNRVKDCLGASLNAIEFFNNNNVNYLENKISLRYLENCIELSGKINKEESENKIEKLNFLKQDFENFYNNKIGLIEEKLGNDELELKTVDLIKQAYENNNLTNYWDDLNSIIN